MSNDLLATDDDDSATNDRPFRPGASVTLHGEDRSAVHTQSIVASQEQSLLRKEILELYRQKENLEKAYHGLQWRIVSLFGNGMVNQNSDALANSLATVNRLTDAIVGLSVELDRFNIYLRPVLDRLPADDLDRLRLRNQSERVNEQTAKMVALAVSQKETPKEIMCRVIEYNPSLQVVVLSAGWKHGVRAGMIFHAGKDSEVTLKIVEIRPDISAAVAAEGDGRQLVPGMPAVAGKSNNQQ